MKKVLKYIFIVYLIFFSLAFLGESLKTPKDLYEITNKTKGLPDVKIISIERYYQYQPDKSFFVLASNNHIYKIDPLKQEVIKDIWIQGLNNPNGFCIIHSYVQSKKLYKEEFYIADTGNHRIVKIDTYTDKKSITIPAKDFLKLESSNIMDVKYYTHDGAYLALLLDGDKIETFNIETKQLQKSIDVNLQIHKNSIKLKNLPYFIYKNDFKTAVYLESIKNNKVISNIEISPDIGKISYINSDIMIPDNGNRLICIGAEASSKNHDGKIIRNTFIHKIIKYENEIEAGIMYGKTRDKKDLFVIIYKDINGLSYNKPKDGVIRKFFDVINKILYILLNPFIFPIKAG